MATPDIAGLTASAYSRALRFAVIGGGVIETDIDSFLAETVAIDRLSEEARAEFASGLRQRARSLMEPDPLAPHKGANPLGQATHDYLVRLAEAVERSPAAS
ncbi:hypothetical protein ACIKTA_04445 [Hansschlegelia beijingensis]